MVKSLVGLALAAATFVVFSLSIAPGDPGFKDGSKPALLAAIVSTSPDVTSGGAPEPAHVAAVDPISPSFFFAIFAALSAALFAASSGSLAALETIGSLALAAASYLAVGSAGGASSLAAWARALAAGSAGGAPSLAAGSAGGAPSLAAA